MYIILKNISLSTISLLSTKEVGNFLVLMLQRRFNKERTQPRPPTPDPRPHSVLFAIQDGVFGRVACSLDKYKALTPPPQSLPLFPPLPYWTLLHLDPPLLVLSSLRA